MAKQTLPIRALLACGVVAGPLYVLVTLAEALTRDGFDLRQHRFSWLTAGDLGWIHQSNMVLVGLLTVLFAVGVRQALRAGRGAAWAPRLLALFGLAYLVGGLLRADAVVGFPPGTTAEMVHRTWQGAAQNASRSISTIFLLATSGAIASWFAAEGRRGWAWFYPAAIPTVFLALTAVGRLVGGNPTALAFLMTPWIWVTALAVHLYRREAQRPREASAGISPRREFLEILGLVAVSVVVLPLTGGSCAAETAPADSLAVTSSRNSKLGQWAAHTHVLYVPLQSFRAPPPAGVALSTTFTFLHRHEVALTQTQLVSVARGDTVRVDDTARAHTYSIQLGEPLPGV